jgi:hypothetical protein
MKDELIRFETAKLAKEKGFTNIFSEFESVCMYHVDFLGNIDMYDELQGNEKIADFLAPTQSLLQRWLREEHNIHLTAIPTHDNVLFLSKTVHYYYIIGFVNDKHGWGVNQSYYGNLDNGLFTTYEEALEQGLIEALKLIEI